jgi:hypothetical protein
MEGDEIQRLFFILIADERGAARDEARERIAAIGGAEYGALSRGGALIGEAICGNGGRNELANAQKEFGTLPIGSEWNGYLETAGQTLVIAVLSQGGRDAAVLDAMLEHSLLLLSKAQDGGYPLSEFTMERVRRVADGDSRHKALADSIVRQNALLLPEPRRMPRPPASRLKKPPGDGRVRGTAG